MRLTSVIIHSDSSLEDIEFTLRENVFRNRYTIRSIVGIDADEIIPKFYATGAVTGKKYYEFSMKPREIAMRAVVNPQFHVNETVSELRDAIYRLISATRSGELQLQFKSGGTTAFVINGLITKMEVSHFSQLPELQITMTCDDPIFRSVHPIDYAVADLPGANPVRLPDGISTAPHGFSFAVEFTGTVATFTIQDDPTTPDWRFRVSPDGGFVSGDILHFSSEYQTKELWYERGPTITHLMDKIHSDSVWPTIFPGDNPLHFSNIASFDWVSLKYFSAHWGI